MHAAEATATRLRRLATAAVAAAALSVMPHLARAQAQATPTPSSAPVVTVVPVERRELVATVAVTGTLVAREEVFVNAQVSGYEIVSIAADVGDAVAKDQVLATLDTAALDAAVAQAEADVARVNATIAQAESQIRAAQAQIEQTEGALARATKLKTSGNTTQATLDQAQATADTARATLAANEGGVAVAKAQAAQAKVALDLAVLNRGRAEVRAPVAGTVSARSAKVGLIAAAGATPLFTILRDGEVEMQAEVVETELGTIAEGDAARIDVAGVGPVEGTVRLISPVVDERSRLGMVRIAFGADKERPVLRPGLFASGAIVTDRRQALQVPVAAIQSDPDGDVVKVVADGKVRRRVVRTGLVADGMREIVDGAAEGEEVLARAGAFFRDGDAVRAKTTEAEAETAVAEPAR